MGVSLAIFLVRPALSSGARYDSTEAAVTLLGEQAPLDGLWALALGAAVLEERAGLVIWAPDPVPGGAPTAAIDKWSNCV